MCLDVNICTQDLSFFNRRIKKLEKIIFIPSIDRVLCSDAQENFYMAL